MKDFLEFTGIGVFVLIVVLIVFYAVTSMALLIKGVGDRYDHRKYPNIYEQDACDQSTLRIEKLFPTYKLGCWLGEETE